QSKLICSKNFPKEEAWDKAAKQVKRDLFLVSLLPIKEDWKQLNRIKDFSPSSYLLNIKKPLLLMFAENDALVNPSLSIEELKKIFPGGIPRNIDIHVSSGLDHSFRISPLCYKGKYSDLQYSKKSREIIKDWIVDVIK